jgi:hypothetical protein
MKEARSKFKLVPKTKLKNKVKRETAILTIKKSKNFFSQNIKNVFCSYAMLLVQTILEKNAFLN